MRQGLCILWSLQPNNSSLLIKKELSCRILQWTEGNENRSVPCLTPRDHPPSTGWYFFIRFHNFAYISFRVCPYLAKATAKMILWISKPFSTTVVVDVDVASSESGIKPNQHYWLLPLASKHPHFILAFLYWKCQIAKWQSASVKREKLGHPLLQLLLSLKTDWRLLTVFDVKLGGYFGKDEFS